MGEIDDDDDDEMGSEDEHQEAVTPSPEPSPSPPPAGPHHRHGVAMSVDQPSYTTNLEKVRVSGIRMEDAYLLLDFHQHGLH